MTEYFGSLIQVKCCLNKLDKETSKPWHCKIHTGESDKLTEHIFPFLPFPATFPLLGTSLPWAALVRLFKRAVQSSSVPG